MKKFKHFGDKSRLIIICVFLIALPQALAENVVISQVLYNPLGTETGGEAVEIFNPTALEINISGYIIRSESSNSDATIPDGTILAAGAHYLIADAGWSILKDNESWSEADHEEAITLSNTNAGVALVLPNNTIIDAVGWGTSDEINEGLYLGIPTPEVTEGNALLRINYTGNNSGDFFEATPAFLNSSRKNNEETEEINTTNETNKISISFDINNHAPQINNYSIITDESEDEGAQVIPNPGGSKEVKLSALITDPDGYDDIANITINGITEYAVIKNANINATTSAYNITINMKFFDLPGQYVTTIIAKDSISSANATAEFKFLPMAAIYLDAQNLRFENAKPGRTTEILGDFALSTTDTPTIKNIGNTALDFGVYGIDFIDDEKIIEVSNLKYSFDNDFESDISGTVSTELQLLSLGLLPGSDSVTSLGLQLQIPKATQNGNYTGELLLAAVSR